MKAQPVGLNKFVLYTLVFLAMLFLTGGIELLMGRTFFGPDNRFGFWAGDIMSIENSQRVADPYTFTHLEHGLLFFLFVWLVARKLPAVHRFLIALLIEVGWELLENSAFIIQRYREATVGVGYFGDSILNSLCDIIAMSLGFWFALKVPKWVSICTFILIEILLAILIRDNLLLNIIMLIYPIASIKSWQLAAA